MSTRKKNVKIPKNRPMHQPPNPLEIPAIADVVGQFDQQIESLSLMLQATVTNSTEEGRETNVKQRISELKNKLFNLPYWPIYCGDGYAAWTVNRMIRTNRDTGELVRGTVTVVITKNSTPAYTIDAYVTKNFTAGSVVVIPMGSTGPDWRNSVLWNIVDGNISYTKK